MSLQQLRDLAGKLESTLSISGGVNTVEEATNDLVWPELEQWKTSGVQDDLWENVNLIAGGTLRPRGEKHESYKDWYKRSAKLWLTLKSTRHLFLKWLGANQGTGHCDKSSLIVHAAPTVTQLQDAQVREDIERMGEEQEFLLQQRGVTLSQELPITQAIMQLKMKIATSVKMLHVCNDLYNPVGYFSVREVVSPPVTNVRPHSAYTFDRHSLTLPVEWKSELVPELLVAAKDTMEKPRFNRFTNAAYAIFFMMREAYARDIPLVTYDAPTGRKTYSKGS